MPTTPPDLLASADDLKEMLSEIDALAGIDIIVDRQKNLDAEIAKAVAKAKGAAILILLDGWQAPPEGESSYLRLRFSVSVWTRPILRAGAIAESTILGILIREIQGYQPDPAIDYYWSIGDGQSVENQEYRITEFTATFEIDIYPE